MTLVEVLVFSSLALLVLGGSFPLLSRLMASDKAHEERLAAFVFLQRSGEQLGVVPFEMLTNGFAEVNGKYERNVASTNFYKTIPARYRVRLIPRTNNQQGRYYQADCELWWSTKTSGFSRENHHNTITRVLLPDV